MRIHENHPTVLGPLNASKHAHTADMSSFVFVLLRQEGFEFNVY
jgi:hypothetical protein